MPLGLVATERLAGTDWVVLRFQHDYTMLDLVLLGRPGQLPGSRNGVTHIMQPGSARSMQLDDHQRGSTLTPLVARLKVIVE